MDAAWSNQGETMLVSVESTDKFDTSTLAGDCSDEISQVFLAQTDSKRTAENSTTRTEGFRGVTRYRKET